METSKKNVTQLPLNRTTVARAVRRLKNFSGTPAEKLELLAVLRNAGLNSREIGEKVDLSDAYVRNMLRAYDWLQGEKQFPAFRQLKERANVAGVLEHMRSIAARERARQAKRGLKKTA